MPSPYDSILNSVQSLVDDLGLSGVVVKKVKLPKVQEIIDSLPLIAIVPSPEPESIQEFSFNEQNITYKVDVVIIRSNDGDLTMDSDDTTMNWRNQIINVFRPLVTLTGVSSVWNIFVKPKIPLDTPKLSEHYDYSGIRLLIHNIESRS